MPSIFQFSPEYLPLALISLIPGIISVIIVVYIWLSFARNRTTNSFLVFNIGCSVWQISEGLMRISTHAEGALFWNKCISLIIVPLTVSGLHFALLFANDKRLLRSQWFMGGLYVSGVFLFLSVILGFNTWELNKHDLWNWVSDSDLTVIQKIETSWITLFSMLTLFVLARYAYRSRKSAGAIRARSLLLCFGYLVPSITGLIFQVGFPQVLGLGEIPIGSPAIVFFSVASLIALKKYRLFRYSYTVAAAKVLEMMNEGVVIVDTELKVRYVNTGFEKLTGYKKSELLGRSVTELGINYMSGENTSDTSRVSNLSDRSQKRIQAKDGSDRYIFFGHSPYTENSGEITGTIMLYTDVTEIVKSNEKIKEEKRHALQYQSMLLSAQLNPHFMYNSLNSVQYFILDENRELALVFVSEFSKLMRRVLQNSLQEYITLSEEISFLEAYLNLEQKRLGGKFSYVLDVSPDIDTEDLMIPPMLLQPYIENSIVHGLGMETVKGILKISFFQEAGRVVCRIEDNGVGRERGMQVKQMRNGSAHKSHGMNLTKTRIEVLREISDEEHYVLVDDLKNAEGVTMGTRIRVYFPLVNY